MDFFRKLFSKAKTEETGKTTEKTQQEKAFNTESLRTEPSSRSLEDVTKDMKNIDPVTSEHIKPSHQQKQMSQPDKEIIERIEKEKELTEHAEEKKIYHIKKHGRGWQVIAEDADRARRVFETQKEAIDFAKEEALEYLLYRVDGTLRQ